jgi:hypothetical protein
MCQAVPGFFWRTIGTNNGQQHSLAQVPSNGHETPTLAQQLQNAMDAQGIEKMELARRVLRVQGLDPHDEGQREARRRHIQKTLYPPDHPDAVKRPRKKTLVSYARALGLPDDYFKLPPPEPPARPSTRRRSDAEMAQLLRELEQRTEIGAAIVAQIEENRDAIRNLVTSTRSSLEELRSRVRGLEHAIGERPTSQRNHS